MVLDNSATWEPINETDKAFEMVQQVNASAPNIKVVGVGGGGSNAVSRMYKDKLPVVEYYSVNTDAQHLFRCDVAHRIAIGQNLTRGLGSGANPDLGRQAAEESRNEIAKAMEGADMVFLAVGMGGGTGTGASPVVAQIAKETGALTVAVVSRPFSFEANTRKKNADEGIARLKDSVDTLIVIPNDRLLQLNDYGDQSSYSWEDALKMADSVLQQGIQAIAEVVTVPGEINVDFADVRTILSNAGPAWLAIGRGKGEQRAIDAARMATKSPLLDISMDGAKRILFVITGGTTLTLQEVQDAAKVIQDMSDPEANIIFGTCRDPKLEEEVKITMVAASFPVLAETQQMREQELERLLQEAPPQSEEELDVPSFLRRQSGNRSRGFYR
jgi:cell division protein FtsZ